MIDFSDRFTGLMIGLVILMIVFGYLAFFGKVEKKGKISTERSRSVDKT